MYFRRMPLLRSPFYPRLLYACCLLFLAGILLFCGFFLLSSYASLVAWYYRLNDCFYLRETWTTVFFTPAVKAAGNKWCLAGIVLSGTGIWLTARKLRRPPTVSFRLPERKRLLYAAIAAIIALALWVWGNGLVKPGYDEVFSAINVAGDHLFHAWSYYMLPNNHVLFNLLNGLLFHPAADKVLTGRLLSLVAYLATAVWIFYWLRKVTGEAPFSLLATIVLIVHFPAWGFAFQARGYAGYVLAGWVAFASLFYYLDEKRRSWLMMHTLSVITGYALIPSFMYVHITLLLYSALTQLSERKADYVYWKYQVASLCLAFLFYLPALCFSGLPALTENRYVTSSETMQTFVPMLQRTILFYLRNCFIGILKGQYWVSYLIFLLPLSGLFRWRTPAFKRAVFFVLLWTVFIVMALMMKRYPFPRNLFGHFSITLALAILSARDLVLALSRLIRIRILPAVVLPALLLVGGAYLAYDNRQHITTMLYGNDVNADYATVENGLKALPPGSTVGCSDANFYFYYVLERNGYAVSKCYRGDETYLIVGDEEHFPSEVLTHYRAIGQVANCFIYQKITPGRGAE